MPSASQCSKSVAVQTLAYMNEMRAIGEKKKTKQHKIKKISPSNRFSHCAFMLVTPLNSRVE